MASRMDRYYKTDVEVKERSKKNASLYKTIYDDATYSNIEGVATIEKSNEIDISKIKELLQSREEYQKSREYHKIVKPEPDIKPVVQTKLEEDRNYDIRDILNKAKEEKTEENKVRSLNNTQYDILKNLNLKEDFDKHDYLPDDNEIKELINTITSTSIINKMDDRELSLNILDDLKSTGNTMVTPTSAIDELLKQSKENDDDDDTEEMDKSFYTSSLNFGKDDFEEIKDINTNIKKNNILIKILLFVLLMIILATVAFIAYSFIIKK